MKKFNKLFAILCASVLAGSVGAIAGCSNQGKDDHTHNYQYTKVDDTTHKGECKVEGCDQPTVTENHDYGTDGKCAKCGAQKPAEITVTRVTISGDTTAKVGEEVQLSATVEGTGNPAQTVTWTKVSGEGGVTADGKVTATAVGAVKVKATSTVDTSKSAEHTVTFSAAEANLSLDCNYVGLEDSGSLTTTEVAVTYDGTGALQAVSKTPEVASVAYADGKLTITAVKTGKAVIEVTDGTKKAELTAEVATAGLVYETLANDEGVEYAQVSDGEGRTSTDIYIPGYRYQDDAAEGEGALLPVKVIKGAATSDEVIFDATGGAFQETNIVTVYTGDNVERIGGRAFAKCPSLTKVTCGAALNYIMAYAFDSSELLEEVDISGVTELKKIGRVAFAGCTALKEFTIPEKVDALGDAAFQSCTSLKTVRILSTELKKIWGATFLNAGLDEVWISKSVVDIAKDAFGSFNTGADITIKVYYNGTEEEYNAITYSQSSWDFSNALKPSANSGCTLALNCDFAAMLEAEKSE